MYYQNDPLNGMVPKSLAYFHFTLKEQNKIELRRYLEKCLICHISCDYESFFKIIILISIFLNLIYHLIIS